MDPLCVSCGDVSKNLQRILTSDLDYRTGIGKEDFVWRCSVSSILQAASQGCTFCTFVDYVFLKPEYDPQSLGSVPWKKASVVEDLTREEFSAFANGARDATTTCLVCSARVSKDDSGTCYLCRPRCARYIAAHPDTVSASGSPGMLSMTIAVRKSSWELDENTDVEGVSLRGHWGSSGIYPLNTGESVFRVDCPGGK